MARNAQRWLGPGFLRGLAFRLAGAVERGHFTGQRLEGRRIEGVFERRDAFGDQLRRLARATTCG